MDSAPDDDDVGRARYVCHADLAPFSVDPERIAPRVASL
jgi:hypothetical protein